MTAQEPLFAVPFLASAPPGEQRRQRFMDDEGASRVRDLPTAHAAAKIPRGLTMTLIVDTVGRLGPLTDDEIARALAPRHAPTVKSARSRASKRGLLVATGETRESEHGVLQTVWRCA